MCPSKINITDLTPCVRIIRLYFYRLLKLLHGLVEHVETAVADAEIQYTERIIGIFLEHGFVHIKRLVEFVLSIVHDAEVHVTGFESWINLDGLFKGLLGEIELVLVKVNYAEIVMGIGKEIVFSDGLQQVLFLLRVVVAVDAAKQKVGFRVVWVDSERFTSFIFA